MAYPKRAERDWLLYDIEVVRNHSSVYNSLKVFGNISATSSSLAGIRCK
jgi:hypothetical protein